MAFSTDVDAATEALIAQLMAEDLGESYDSHSAPIGSSNHDYEEPLSSYERQCLDAENDPDEEGEEGCGWGPDLSDDVNGAATLGEGLCATGSAGEDTWDSSDGNWESRFIDNDGSVHEHTTSERSPQAAGADKDCNHSDSNPCLTSENAGLTGSPARVASIPAHNAPTNPAGETRNISAPSTFPTETRPCQCPGPVQVPDDHVDDPPRFTSPPSSSLPPAADVWGVSPAPQPASTTGELESQWDDGLDYSCSKGKGKAVRAYDEFKQGLRNNDLGDRWTKLDIDSEEGHDIEEEGEVCDEDLPFIRIPWPSTEPEELLSRREDAEVVEIHVGDDETLESILRDISLRDERRQKGKAVEGRVECVGEEVREREERLGRKDVEAWFDES